MNTTALKLLLAGAILFLLWRMVRARAAVPRPYEDFGDEDEDAEGFDAADDDDAEEGFDDDDEAEEGFDDDDDSDAGGDPTEGFANLPALSADLLPKPNPSYSSFGEFAPTAAGLTHQNFLDPTKFVGVDTQGSSLRNANRDLRSAPAIPRKPVGPWMQSDIDPDPWRRPLE